MARIAKSLVPPEQGYPHREHRSAKGRNPLANRINRKKRYRRKKLLDEINFGKKRKGKWI